MALKIRDYELPDKTIIPEAYLRVQNAFVENRDYEFFDTSDKESVELELKWTTRTEMKATVFVWADEIARQHRTTALHGFNVELDYEVGDCDCNVFGQVYEKLKTLYPTAENC